MNGGLIGSPSHLFYDRNDKYGSYVDSPTCELYFSALRKGDSFESSFCNIVNSGGKGFFNCPLCYNSNVNKMKIIDYKLYCVYCGKNLNINDYWIRTEQTKDIGRPTRGYCSNCAKLIRDYDPQIKSYKRFFDVNIGLRHLVNGEEKEIISSSLNKPLPKKSKKSAPPYWFQGKNPPKGLP